MRWLQNHPRMLELAYQSIDALLNPFQRWLTPGGWIGHMFSGVEQVSKGMIFDCQMCGQCTLHSTGMTCPMTCPKTMRNGPCGGVTADGCCEIKPEIDCIWVQAWQRSTRMTNYGQEFMQIQAPLDNQLMGTSAWINDLNRDVHLHPKGWQV